jgi:hypothetical protein
MKKIFMFLALAFAFTTGMMVTTVITDTDRTVERTAVSIGSVNSNGAILSALMSGVLIANARADSTSETTSVYVAGKGKYCKETAVSGYLDCFYTSPDACQKHNKSANLRCVSNPNSGT